MLIAILNDTHWGARSESADILSHQLTFYRDLFFPYLQTHNIKTVCHLGDLVDRRKFIQYSILNSMRTHFIKPLIDLNIDTHILVGNHDAPFRNSNEVNAVEELFASVRTATWSPHIYANPETVDFDGCSILMMPWINMTNEDDTAKAIQTTTAKIVFGHLEIKGFEMYKGLPSYDGISPGLFEKFEMVCSGHFHCKSTLGNINYLGAPMEMTWADYDDPRGFHIFDTDTKTLTYIQNPNRLFYKIFYSDRDKSTEEILNVEWLSYASKYVKVIVLQKDHPLTFDTFMDRLNEVSPADISIVEDHHNAQLLNEHNLVDQAEDTLTIISHFIENLEGTVDKAALNTLLRDLYTESLAMDTHD